MASTATRTVLSLLVLFCGVLPATAATWFVDSNAAADGDGSAGRPLRSLAAASKASAPGDTIVVARGSGPYAERIELAAGQTLLAADAPAGGAAPTIVASSGAAVTMKAGSTLAGVRVSAKETAIVAVDAAGVAIRGVELALSGAARGIVAVNVSRPSVHDTTIAYDSRTAGGNACGTAAGAEELACGSAIQLHNVDGATLESLIVKDAPRAGITADAVRDLTLTAVEIRGAGDAHDEHGVLLRNAGGVLRVGKSRFDKNAGRQLRLIQEAGEVTLEIRDSSFRGAAPPHGQQAVLIEVSGEARLRVAISSSTFDDHFGNAVQINADGASAVDAEVTGNTFRKSAAAVAAAATNRATLTYRIASNAVTGSSATALSVHSATQAPVSGEIVDNTIGAAGKAGSGAACGGGCSGISVTATGRAAATAIVARNTIHQTDAHGILARAGGDATLNVSITGNAVREPAGSDALHAIAVVAGMRKTDRAVVCAELGGEGALVNSVSGSWNAAAGGASIGVTRRGDTTSLAIARYAGERANAAGLSKFVAGRNRGAAVHASVGAGVTLSDGCVGK